jgi:hypothetical protein
MNWLKKILGHDTQNEKLDALSSLAEQLLKKENFGNDALRQHFDALTNKVENTLENTNQFILEVKSTHQKMLTSLEEENRKSIAFKEVMQNDLTSVKNEVIKIAEEVLPKPFNPNFKLVDPLDSNKTLFSFEVTNVSVSNKRKIDSDLTTFFKVLGGNMPNLIGSGLLANSYRFVFPSGVSGTVMQLTNGQGTAISQGGKIVGHGAYASNVIVAAPLIVFNIGNVIVQQHYLAKINENLKAISNKVSQLLELEFIKKQSKIESIIYFFERAQVDFPLIENNKEYRTALLSNIVRTNTEIFELIQFYKKSFKFIDKEDSAKNELNFRYFIALHKLFYQGKLMEFKYAYEYNEVLINNLKNSFTELNKQSLEFINENKIVIQQQMKITDDSIRFYDRFIGRRDNKLKTIESLKATNSLVDAIISNQTEEANKIVSELEQFRYNLTRKQEFLIEGGELYEVLN